MRSRSRPTGRPRSRPHIGAGGQVRARACFDRTPGSSFRIVESQLQEVGRSIHAASREVSASDARARREGDGAGLPGRRAARGLFRFVDVTPACRSLDDLARHLAGYLERLTARRRSRPPCGCRSRGRDGRRSARRLPRACATWRTASSWARRPRPRSRFATLGDGEAVSLDLLGEATVTEDEADRYAKRCRRAREARRRVRALPDRPLLRRLARPATASEPVGEGVRAHAAVRPEAPEVGREDAARRMRPLWCERENWSAPAHRHGVVDPLEATLGSSSSCSTSRSCARGPRRASCAGVPARVARQLERIIAWARASGRAPSWSGS